MTEPVEEIKEAVKQIVPGSVRDHIHLPRDLGAASADWVSQHTGWWPAVAAYVFITIGYLIVNHWVSPFDRTLQYYTFMVSVLAILLEQVILLAENRSAERDRSRDDVEAEEVRQIYDATQLLQTINQQQLEILEELRQGRAANV